MIKPISVPKKSREKKFLSQERRQLQLMQMFSSQKTAEVPAPHPIETVGQTLEKTVDLPMREEAVSSKTYFLKDFRKSVILIAGIIALEIAVYFGTINNYLKF